MQRHQKESAGITIGIDARAAAEVPAGRGRVVRELLAQFARDERGHRFLCYARSKWDGVEAENLGWRLVASPDPHWHLRTARAASRECDVFLSTNSYLTVPLLRIPCVTIVYDLVTFERGMHPNRRSMVIERFTLGTAVGRSKELLCISKATEEALTARFPAAASKSSVALLGVSPELSDAKLQPPEELPEPGFILAVGTLEPRKNLPRLVAAYAALPQDLQDAHPLVVVGPLGWQVGATLTAVRSLGERCIVLGHVSDAALAELYRRCAAFCYPSLGEGFGLPVLEAMAAGAAVITSDISSLPEVGGDAVEYVDPSSEADIARGIRRLLSSPERREELSARAQRRAREFSWERTAAVILRALERSAAWPPPPKPSG